MDPIASATDSFCVGKDGDSREDVAYVEQMRTVISRGREDITSGRYVEGIDGFLQVMGESTVTRSGM